MKAAHIVPYSLPPAAIDYICGSGTGSRQFSWENGLLLTHALERHLDKGDVVIMPLPGSCEARATRFVLRIAVHELENAPVIAGLEKETTLGDIDGKELQFRNNRRPMLRFLYWRYIISMLGNQRNRPDFAWQRYDTLKSATPWMTLRPYLRKGVLLTMAKEAGCMDDERTSLIIIAQCASLQSMLEIAMSIVNSGPKIQEEYCLDRDPVAR